GRHQVVTDVELRRASDLRSEDLRSRLAVDVRQIARPEVLGRVYSGQPCTCVRGQACVGSRVIAPLVNTAMKPRSLSGAPPLNTGPPATATEQTPLPQVLESYGCAMAGGEPIGNAPGLLKLVKPAPATAHPSPFRSAKLLVAPAVVNSAFRMTCVVRSSPGSN